ncbi:MAG: hypothetical protein JWO02_721 [Solirubrobacterales bacterium]|nr:hypothetical protein [Solirubrobacterales bacterium]
MHSTVRRFAALAAVVATMGIAGPVANASAAGTPVAPKFALPGLPGAGLPGLGLGAGLPGAGLPGAGLPGAGLPGAGLPGASFVGPSVGRLAAVIGPTIITTAPGVTFINTNNQVTAGGAAVGPQVG